MCGPAAGLCFACDSYFKCRPSHSITSELIATRIVALTPSLQKLRRIKTWWTSVNGNQFCRARRGKAQTATNWHSHIIVVIFCIKNYRVHGLPCSVVCVIIRVAVLGTTSACDRQAHRQTDTPTCDDSKYRASIASCGQNSHPTSRTPSFSTR